MKQTLRKSVLSLTLAASVMGSAAWSTASYACPSEAYITSVCIMGMRNAFTFDGFMPAVGTQLPVNQYQAVMSLIGNTYGGDGVNNIKLPDLRGRVVIGAGLGTYANAVNYNVGQTGGASVSSGSVTLTSANLPPHIHTLTTSPTGVTVAVGGSFSGTTSLTGAKINASVVASALTIQGSTSSATGTGNLAPASGFYLGSTATLRIYNSATPLASLAPGSLVGIASTSTIPLDQSTPVAVTINGAPTVTVGGVTGVTGSGAPATVSVPTMMPYLAMNYYFATLGVYPVNSN